MFKKRNYMLIVMFLIMAFVFSMILSACTASEDSEETEGQDIKTEINISDQSGSDTTELPVEPSVTAEDIESNHKILIVYFSRVGISESFDGVDAVSAASLPDGNTIVIANMIAEATGGDMFQIITEKIYPAGYNEISRFALDEQKANERPALKNSVGNWDSYDTIFIGYPNWWATCPMAVFAFLEEYDFTGKTIIPFCTHEGSRLGSSEKDIADICPEATLLEGLAIRATSVYDAKGEVEEWLDELGLSL